MSPLKFSIPKSSSSQKKKAEVSASAALLTCLAYFFGPLWANWPQLGLGWGTKTPKIAKKWWGNAVLYQPGTQFWVFSHDFQTNPSESDNQRIFRMTLSIDSIAIWVWYLTIMRRGRNQTSFSNLMTCFSNLILQQLGIYSTLVLDSHLPKNILSENQATTHRVPWL